MKNTKLTNLGFIKISQTTEGEVPVIQPLTPPSNVSLPNNFSKPSPNISLSNSQLNKPGTKFNTNYNRKTNPLRLNDGALKTLSMTKADNPPLWMEGTQALVKDIKSYTSKNKNDVRGY